MGCSSPQNAGLPHVPAQHFSRLMQVSQIGHPLNINKKYEFLAKIDESQKVGEGCRRTYAYNALGTKQQIEEKRKQFWESRTSGKSTTWEALHQVVKAATEQQASRILRANNISMINDTIGMCIDSKLNKYEVPIFCINDPISYSMHNWEDRNLQFEFDDKMMEITIRSTKYPNEDIKLQEQASEDVAVIKDAIKEMKSLPDSTSIRLFYAGREMKIDRVIGNYSYVPGTVIQAMII